MSAVVPGRNRLKRPSRNSLGLVALALLTSACALTSSTQIRFYPSSAEAAGAPFVAGLARSCELDDCRVQQVELRMPDGEVLTGQLRFLPAGVTPVDPFSAPVPATGAVLDETPRHRSAVMTAVGNRGSRLRCELVFTAGARHAAGVCKSASGATYTVEI